MLNHPTHERLIAFGLHGMAKAFEEQRRQPDIAALDFEERLGLMIDREARGGAGMAQQGGHVVRPPRRHLRALPFRVVHEGQAARAQAPPAHAVALVAIVAVPAVGGRDDAEEVVALAAHDMKPVRDGRGEV